MKTYVIMANLGSYEGWRIIGEADSFDEAVAIREANLFTYCCTIAIFRPVEMIVTEKPF